MTFSREGKFYLKPLFCIERCYGYGTVLLPLSIFGEIQEFSGVVPANQTEGSEVRELSRKDSGNRGKFANLTFLGLVQDRKISPKRKFLGRISRGHPRVIRADIPAQYFGQGAQNPGKKQAFGRGFP